MKKCMRQAQPRLAHCLLMFALLLGSAMVPLRAMVVESELLSQAGKNLAARGLGAEARALEKQAIQNIMREESMTESAAIQELIRREAAGRGIPTPSVHGRLTAGVPAVTPVSSPGAIDATLSVNQPSIISPKVAESEKVAAEIERINALNRAKVGETGAGAGTEAEAVVATGAPPMPTSPIPKAPIETGTAGETVRAQPKIPGEGEAGAGAGTEAEATAESGWSTKKKVGVGAAALVGAAAVGAGSYGIYELTKPDEEGPSAAVAKTGAVLVVNLPTDILPETGDALSIAVGSRDNVLEAWCISLDGKKLLRYDVSQTSAANPWVAMPAQDEQGKDISPLKSVSVSSDGIMMVLNAQGEAYEYDWDKKQFFLLSVGSAYEYDQKQATFTKTGQPLSFDRISVGDDKNVWAVDSTHQVVYQLDTSINAWEPRGNGIQVAAGIDGTVIMIDPENIPHSYDAASKSWIVMPGQQLDDVAVATKGIIYGVYQGVLFQYLNDEWTQIMGADGKPTSGVSDVAVNAADTLFIIDKNGTIYNRGDAAVQVTQTVVPAKTPRQKPMVIRTIKKAAPKKVSRYRSKAVPDSTLGKKINDSRNKSKGPQQLKRQQQLKRKQQQKRKNREDLEHRERFFKGGKVKGTGKYAPQEE